MDFDDDEMNREEEEEGEESEEENSSHFSSRNSLGESKSTPPNYTSFGVEKSLSIDVSGDRDSSESIPPPTNFSIYPSLRGRLARENGLDRCSGVWAMTDSAHGLAGQTSDFEFRLVSPAPDPSQFPVSGNYVGWFMLKQPMKGPLKIDDKEMKIEFHASNNGVYDITGTGSNKFGKFSLYGTLELPGTVQLYRVYTPKKTAPTPKSTKTAKTPTFASPRSGKTPSAPLVAPSPREPTGQRVRKPSAVLAGTFEIAPSPAPIPTKRHIEPEPQPVVPAGTPSGRIHRAPPFLAKCKDILKDMSKQPLSIYFNEPVDPIKLNIPDYLTIVKDPMDFGTIRKQMESNFYSTHEHFAEHMRLVFRNAIAYNVRRDNPVHIAARELSDMFEERYRVMVSQLAVYAVTYDDPILPAPKKSSIGRARGSKSFGRASGPRDSGLLALDSSAQAMRMMQQKMLEMEAEINSLRTAVRQSDIRATIGHQMVAAQAPLTYEEKKILIANIMKLDGDQMTAVVDIIQSAMPTTACGDGDEVEIPVDELDTYTLRQLQEHVQNALTAKSKKRSIAAPSPSNRGRASNPPKRSRNSSASAPATPVPTPLIPQLPVPSSEPFSPSAPTFFSTQSYVESVEIKPESLGRKRSNSLDFFPAGEENGTESASGNIENPDAWMSVAENQTPSQSQSGQGGWGDALQEKHLSESRKMTLQAEAEKSKELRSKLEEERSTLAQERASQKSGAEILLENQTRELERLREEERQNREGLAPTVSLSDVHSTLYNHNLYEM